MAMPAPGPPPGGGPHPFWRPPSPYGYALSIDAAGTVAAPLLAGFSITMLGLILGLGDAQLIRLRDPAVALLTVAALLLLCCVQCSFWAREYAVTPEQIVDWWPDIADRDAAGDDRRDQVREEQWTYRVLASCWLGRARRTYHYGILALLAALTLVLVPNDLNSWRSLATAMAGLGFLAELYWIVAPGHRNWPASRALFPDLADAHVTPPTYTGSSPQP